MIAALALAALSQANPAASPADRMGEPWWKERHEQRLELAKNGADLVFIGDSITQGWEGEGRAVWEREYAPLKALNLGYSGDRTEHVLWRLHRGELAGVRPRAIVIMIGTNNVGHGSSDAAQTSRGIRSILNLLRHDLPEARILLLGVFPRGERPDDRLRLATAEITRRIAPFADGRAVFFADIGGSFVRPDGMLRMDLMPDQLHLNSAGYEAWAKAMRPALERALGSGKR